MKTFITLLFFLVNISVFAQTNSIVSITVPRDKNTELVVDSKTYTVNSSNNTSIPITPVVITDLQPGSHTLQMYSLSTTDDTRRRMSSAPFNTRTGFNLAITVNNDGSLQLNETRNRVKISNNGDNSRFNPPMSDASFNSLLQNVQNNRRYASRITAVTNAFSNTNNYFKTAQARQLIQIGSVEPDRLALAKASYRGISDPQNFRQLYDLFSIQSNRNDLDAFITAQKTNGNGGRSNHGKYTRKTPMSDANFNILLKDAQRQWIPGAKMTAASNAFSNPNNYFTTAQARQLIQIVNDEGNRVLLAKTAYGTIVDPANFNQLYDLFENQISKDDLTAYINNYNNKGIPPSNNQKVAMADASFNDLLQSTQRQWLPGAKMTAATNAFSNTNYYFTTAQARELITVVNEETNRLQLAKLSYRSIVDPNNFSQLYELFSNQVNRDNLVAYVNSYNSGNVNNKNNSQSTSKIAMTDANFKVLLKEAQAQWRPGGKMSAATNAFSDPNNYFTTAQARQLIIMVDDESNRLQLAKLSYRSVVDYNNFPQIYEVLTSQQNKNDLAAYVSSYNVTNGINNNNNGTTTQYKTAMPDAQFTVLIDNVKRQWIPGTRITVISNAFANTDNYFTTYQARQLLQYLNDEGNRLQQAKASYRSIVDPSNFSQLYDLFTSQASKDELAAYVRNSH